MKEKMRTSSFWLGVGGAIILVLNCVCGIFGFKVCSEQVEGVIVTICSCLVMLGIVTKRNVSDAAPIDKKDLIADIENFKTKSDNSDID